MDDYQKSPMMPPTQQSPEPPRGGLASDAVGGLSKFIGNVTKGIDMVLSHPLYARAWSGLVSGQTGDPTAGPFALAQLQQAYTQNKYQEQQIRQNEIPTARERLDQMALEARELSQAARDRIFRDPRSATEADWGQGFPQEAGRSHFSTQTNPSPVQVIGADGRPVYVEQRNAIGMQPVPRSALVQIGDQSLNPYQTAQTRSHYIDQHAKESEPYLLTMNRLNELNRLLADLGDAEPNPSQSEAAATAFSKGLKPGEAVMRDDIARILGQGFENIVKGWVNLPQKATRAQISQMRDTLRQMSDVAEYRQRATDEKYMGLTADYGETIRPIAPDRSQQVPPPPQAMSNTPPPDAPPGTVPHPTINGLFVAPDGTFWVN